MGDKKITDKIADAAKTIFDTAKSVATSKETKAALASAKETISKAVKSHGKQQEAANEATNADPTEGQGKTPGEVQPPKEDVSGEKMTQDLNPSTEKQESSSEEKSPSEENKKES